MKKKAIAQYMILIACIVFLVGYQGFLYHISQFGEIMLTYLPRITVALLVILSVKVILGTSKPFIHGVFETSTKIYDTGERKADARTVEEARNILRLWDYLVWAAAILLILSIMVQDVGAFFISFGLIGFGLTM